MQSDNDLKAALLKAILPHVAFDGWTEAGFGAAIADCNADPTRARALYPRGAIDLAVAFHKAGDLEMARRIENIDQSEMRIRDRIALAVMTRLDVVDDKDVVRRGAALFGLPHHGPEGARLIWGTSDAIWKALGDTSRDINWYTKRATLSAVYASTLLYWLGEDSQDHRATREFLDRRIADVMQFERAKAGVRNNAFLSKILAGPLAALDRVKAPGEPSNRDLPGYWPSGDDRATRAR